MADEPESEPRSRTSGFGSVDRLPTGRWRARYTGPDGQRRTATFVRKTDARSWLATAQADLVRRRWRAPESGRRTVGAYAADYLARGDLREGTRALYEATWRNHLATTWVDVPVGDITPALVRLWHERAALVTRPTALAQSYRLLRAILNVAVADDVLASNPCRLRTAGSPRPARPSRSLSVGEVQALADAVPARYRTLVLVLAFGGLRFGEATALRRGDIARDGSTVRVERAVRHVNGRPLVGPVKTDAGRRTVALPPTVAAEMRRHLATFVPAGAEALVFGTRTGNYLARSNFTATFHRAVRATGLPAVRVHELRHTGATLAAHAGASTAELMHRLGHASPAAALVYQHATKDRDAEIARALDALSRRPAVTRRDPPPGRGRAR